MVPTNDMFGAEKEHEKEAPLRTQLDPAVYKSLERNACLKIDLQVLPLCLLLYLLSFLDRTNVSQSMMDRGETRPDGSIKDPGIMTSLDMTHTNLQPRYRFYTPPIWYSKSPPTS